ncbi:MAG: WG repeat-containing protein [Candidatus Fimenecus sp.]
MKNTKRIISIILLFAILLTSFTACKKKESAENDGTGEQNSQPQDVQKIEDPKITYLDKTWKDLGDYSEGLIAARDNTSGLWGYIDKTGEYVIEPAYYDALPFSEGLAAVKTVTGFYSFIDKTGKEVIKGEYSGVSASNGKIAGYEKFYKFSKGYTLVNLGEEGFNNAKPTLIDTKGNIIKGSDVEYIDFIDCGEFAVGVNDIYNSNSSTNGIYDFKYDKIADCSGIFCSTDNKYVMTRTYNSGNENDEYTYRAYDGKGNIVFDETNLIGKLGADCVFYIKNEYIIAEKNFNGINTCAVYDLQLNEIIAPGKYNRAFPISDELFIVKNNASNWAIIDKSGKEYMPFESRYTYSITTGITFEDAKKISENGIVDYIVKNEDESKNGKYFDIQTKEVKDTPVLTTTIDNYIYTHTARGCSYDNEKSGIYYLAINSYDNEFEVFNSKCESIGQIKLFINMGKSYYRLGKEDCIPFLKENIAPVKSPNGNGLTLAIIG